MKVLITASGGGHTGYAVAIAQRLRGKADMFFAVPEGDKWSASKVRSYGEVVYVKKARGPRDPLWRSVPNLIGAFLQSVRRVGRVDVVVATGSNHCVPPSIAGKLRGARLVTIESSVRFTKASLSIRALTPLADILALQWSEQKLLHKGGVVVGPIYELPEHRPWNGGYVLVTGGTYGHKALFDAISDLGLDNVVLQTGRIDPRPYMKRHPTWKVFDFDPDFGRWLAGAKVVVTHFGKTAVDAVLSYRKPTIIVLNPEWRYTVGREDAEILARKLNAVLLSEVTAEAVRDAINDAVKRTLPMYEDGAENLANLLLRLIS